MLEFILVSALAASTIDQGISGSPNSNASCHVHVRIRESIPLEQIEVVQEAYENISGWSSVPEKGNSQSILLIYQGSCSEDVRLDFADEAMSRLGELFIYVSHTFREY